jgi:hypothetical protein
MLLFQQNTGICTMLGQKRGLYAPLMAFPLLPHFSAHNHQPAAAARGFKFLF